MEIQTTDPTLPFDLRDTKPDGVSVAFDNPRFTRDYNSVEPVVLITICFAANVDVPAVLDWLMEKLNGRRGTTATHKRKELTINRDGFRLVIEEEKRTKS